MRKSALHMIDTEQRRSNQVLTQMHLLMQEDRSELVDSADSRTLLVLSMVPVGEVHNQNCLSSYSGLSVEDHEAEPSDSAEKTYKLPFMFHLLKLARVSRGQSM
jgi:hypothetical protein